jgi:hypothetical protein
MDQSMKGPARNPEDHSGDLLYGTPNGISMKERVDDVAIKKRLISSEFGLDFLEICDPLFKRWVSREKFHDRIP